MAKVKPHTSLFAALGAILSLSSCAAPPASGPASIEPTSAPVSASVSPTQVFWEPQNDTSAAAAGLNVNSPELSQALKNAPLKTGGLQIPQGWQAAALTPTVLILADYRHQLLRAISLEDGEQLWQVTGNPVFPFRKVLSFNDRVITDTGISLDAATGIDTPLVAGFDPGEKRLLLNTSLDNQVLFISKPVSKGYENYILRTTLNRPFASFSTPQAQFQQLVGPAVFFSGLVYDPITSQAVKTRPERTRNNIFIATTEGVVLTNSIVTPQHSLPVTLLPWTATPTAISAGNAALASEPKDQQIPGVQARARCLVNQIVPLPSLQTFKDFCASTKPLPRPEITPQVTAWGGISGPSGRMWFYETGEKQNKKLSFTADLSSSNALVLDSYGHLSSDQLWGEKLIAQNHHAIVFFNPDGKIVDLFSLPTGYTFNVLGALGTQRYLCTHRQVSESPTAPAPNSSIEKPATNTGRCLKIAK
ncbi:hypothetical protein KRX54_01960 [Actinomycetaceae bacterium TAE3-ERU4]|nr:hypothetical protein [Actinomycetaceae bacterium TAE3-ERU4]